MSDLIELEIEIHKVVKVDLDDLKAAYPREWAEFVEDFGEDAGTEFVIECYCVNSDRFQSTPHDSTEYHVTRLEAATPSDA